MTWAKAGATLPGMGSLSAAAVVFLSVTKGARIGLIVIGAVVVVLLIAILVLDRRRRSAKRAPSAEPQSLFADPQSTAGGPAPNGLAGSHQGQPFADLSPGGGAWEVPSPPAGPPALGNPPPGTPAGWLPEPGGTPDTLRYWDGFAWTEHLAQRS